MPLDHQRKYDIVIFGASGFTGALICEYLLERKDKDVKWALSGRSREKLEKTKDQLIQCDASANNLDILIANVNDPDTLDAMLQQTRVLINTVGPFIKYGTPLVEACLRQKTHYVDITGEHTWIKTIIDQCHEKAKHDNVMIVPACGFDSVPSDLGTFMLAEHIRQKHKLNLANVKMSLTKVVGGISGGTIQSVLAAMHHSGLSAKQSFDPYLLSPIRGTDTQYWPWMRKDSDFGDKWQAYFVMSVVNEKVVRRSWGLWTERGLGYGRMFQYRENMSLSLIPAFLLTAALFTIVPLFAVAAKIPLFRRAIQRLVPSSGEGPSPEQRGNGHFEFQFIGTAETEPYDDPFRVRGVVRGFRDPGYGDTCRMVCESALCIVKDMDNLPGREGGVLTPSTAFGHALLERLRANDGMIFKIEE